jgi:hypothetical protein
MFVSKSACFKRSINFILTVVSFLMFAATGASAQVVFSDDPVEFFEKYPLATVQTFTSGIVPPGIAVACGAVLDEDNTDPCFPAGSILPGIRFESALIALAGQNFEGTAGNPLPAVADSTGVSDLRIVFTGGQTNVAAIGPGCFTEGGFCTGTLAVEVFGQSGLLAETDVEVTSGFEAFLAMESAVPITEIRIVGPGEFFEGLDGMAFTSNQTVENIPTLSEWGMIAAAAGFALVGMFYAMRKRRASA